jgi:hypothetical protein
MRVSENLREA